MIGCSIQSCLFVHIDVCDWTLNLRGRHVLPLKFLQSGLNYLLSDKESHETDMQYLGNKLLIILRSTISPIQWIIYSMFLQMSLQVKVYFLHWEANLSLSILLMLHTNTFSMNRTNHFKIWDKFVLYFHGDKFFLHGQRAHKIG